MAAKIEQAQSCWPKGEGAERGVFGWKDGELGLHHPDFAPAVSHPSGNIRLAEVAGLLRDSIAREGWQVGSKAERFGGVTSG